MSLSPALIRRLWSGERDLFREHLQRLDADARHDRFGRAVDDSYLASYAQSCFGLGDLVFGAFVDGVMRGAAELRSSGIIALEQAAGRRTAESALSVEPAWRRRGIGRALFRRVLRAARNHGVDTVEVFCAPENPAMMALAREAGKTFAVDHDQAAARIRVRAPTALSLAGEIGADWMDLLGAALGAQAKLMEAGLAAFALANRGTRGFP